MATILKIRLLFGVAGLVVLGLTGRLAFSSPGAPVEPLRLPPPASATPAPAALTAFASRVSSGGINARARIDGVMHFSVPFYEVRATTKFSGTKASVKYDAGSSRALLFSTAGGTARVRSQGLGWRSLPSGVRNGNPFGKPAAIEVQYAGRTKVSGKGVHHLTISNPRSLAVALGGAEMLTQLQPEFSAFEVYVTEKGVPVSARVRFKGTAALDGVSITLNIDYRYTFTKVS